MTDYLKTADAWTVLDLIVAEFDSDPMSVQCFDLRLVARAKELNREHRDLGLLGLETGDHAVGRLSARLKRERTLTAELLAALKHAVETIRIWHGFGHATDEAEVWALYQQSPEMRTITKAIQKAEGIS